MDEELYEKVFLKILRFISHKPRTEKEVLEKLNKIISQNKEDGSSEDIKNRVIEDLKEKRYLGDIEYAEEYVRGTVSSGKTRSKRRIKQNLIQKGVSREILAKALELLPPDYEYNCALKDAEKKLRLLVGKSSFIKKRKISDYLYGKGYSPTAVSSVVDTLVNLK